ncbi:MAG: hypothetical protein ACT4NL_14765 [Pseudomarimonas sp.]
MKRLPLLIAALLSAMTADASPLDTGAEGNYVEEGGEVRWHLRLTESRQRALLSKCASGDLLGTFAECTDEQGVQVKGRIDIDEDGDCDDSYSVDGSSSKLCSEDDCLKITSDQPRQLEVTSQKSRTERKVVLRAEQDLKHEESCALSR